MYITGFVNRAKTTATNFPEHLVLVQKKVSIGQPPDLLGRVPVLTVGGSGIDESRRRFLLTPKNSA